MKLTAMLLLGIALLACDKTRERGALSEQADPLGPVFSNLQNDQQGYADVKWGAGITDAVDSNTAQRSANCFATGDPRESDAIAAAFRTPIRDYSTPGFVIENLDFSVVPQRCQIAPKGDVRFIFYDGKLAMASTRLDAHNYQAIAAEMTSKFSEIPVPDQPIWQRGTLSVEIRLFKRGDTNTRIFLLKRTDSGGCCDVDVRVYLLYVPNFYYEQIRKDMSKLKGEQQAQQTAEQWKVAQPDLQKIQ